MTKKIVQKKDYLGQPICKGKKEDGKCPKYDVNTEKWECEEIIETEEITVTSGGEGTKKDVACCMVKTKHENCLKCKDMDCSHGTCSDFVNKKYYSERELAPEPLDDKAAMKEAGWGL